MFLEADVLCGVGYAGQVDLEIGAIAGFTLRENVTATLLHDSVDRRKSQAGAFPLFLGGKEWFENSRLGFLVHASAGIQNRKQDVRPRLNQGVFSLGGILIGLAGLNDNFPAIGHGVLGIYHQVHDDLFQLAGIGTGVAYTRGQPRRQLNVLAD